MKKVIFVLVSALTLGFLTSCNNEDNNIVSNDQLIETIENSSSKENIEPSELPSTAADFVDEEHFETYIETVSYVEGKGYEVTLGTEDMEYFDTEGNVLRSNRFPLRAHRPGPCGGGQRIRIDSLPDAITTYITENYPDEEIRRAKIKGNFYLVAITGPTILIFNMDEEFVNEAPLFRFCFGERIPLDELNDNIVTYINENCPDGEIKIAYLARGKIIVGVLTPEGRKIFVFTPNGVFLFER